MSLLKTILHDKRTGQLPKPRHYTAAFSAPDSPRSWLQEFVLDTSLFAALYGDGLVPGKLDHSYVQFTFFGGSIKAFLLVSLASNVALRST